MAARITSLHHVTATVGEAQPDVTFYTRTLGLRLVKRTVNFDNPGVYHFYYGDARGTPGTIMTTFPYAGMGVRVGTKGAGQITATAFSVPADSLGAWRTRLGEHGFRVEERGERFGEEVIAFSDPSGLVLELVGRADVPAPTWLGNGVDAGMAIRRVYSVTLEVRDPARTVDLLGGALGLDRSEGEGRRQRFRAGERGQVGFLDVLHSEDAPLGINGLGTVHHVALAVASDDAQRDFQERLRTLGFQVTDVRDRQYFQSIYFREPGGILLEIATEGPGFLIDETEEKLGESLRLPPWEEARREEIGGVLPRIET